MKAGAVDYLLKPVDENILYELINKINDMIIQENKDKEQLEQFKDIFADSMDICKERFVISLTEGVISDSIFKKRLEEFGVKEPDIFNSLFLDWIIFSIFKKKSTWVLKLIFLIT